MHYIGGLPWVDTTRSEAWVKPLGFGKTLNPSDIGTAVLNTACGDEGRRGQKKGGGEVMMEDSCQDDGINTVCNSIQ